MKKTGNPSDAVSCADLADKADKNLNLVYFGDAEGEAYDTFISVAKDPRGEKWAFMNTGAECAADYGVAAGGLSVIRKFDEPKVAYSGEMNKDAIVDWMASQSTPTIFEFSEDYIEPIFQNRGNAIFLFSEDKEAAYQKVFADGAVTHKGKVLFSTSGVSSGIQERLGEFLGVTKEDMPTMRIVSPGDDLKKF